jgi:hypothetical protein
MAPTGSAQGTDYRNHKEDLMEAFARDQELARTVIPAKVPRQARDPELVERAGKQKKQGLLDPDFRRGDDFAGILRVRR